MNIGNGGLQNTCLLIFRRSTNSTLKMWDEFLHSCPSYLRNPNPTVTLHQAVRCSIWACSPYHHSTLLLSCLQHQWGISLWLNPMRKVHGHVWLRLKVHGHVWLRASSWSLVSCTGATSHVTCCQVFFRSHCFWWRQDFYLIRKKMCFPLYL